MASVEDYGEDVLALVALRAAKDCVVNHKLPSGRRDDVLHLFSRVLFE